MNEKNSKNKKGMSMKGQRTLPSSACSGFMYCLSMPPDLMAH